MTSLSKKLGAHAGLLGMASSLMFGVTPAYAATDFGDVPLTVNVGSIMDITTSNPDLTALLTAGISVSNTDNASFSIATNALNGFNVSALGSNTDGTGGCATSVLCHNTTTGTAIVDASTKYPTGGPASGVSTDLGLIFRVASVTNITGTDEATNFPAGAYAAFPMGSPEVFLNTSDDSISTLATPAVIDIEYKVEIPATQAEGVYTGNVRYTATTNP